jgi:phosphodiesterase/alkaline phosphatase D-like protein
MNLLVIKVLRSILLLSAVAFLAQCNNTNQSVNFQSEWPNSTRVWIGPEYWANPMQDWQLSNGRVECITSGGDRNLFLLTHELDSTEGDLYMKITVGSLETNLSSGWVGFKLGVKGEFGDYRDNAVRGEGMPVGITGEGKLFIGFLDPDAPSIDIYKDQLTLVLKAITGNNGTYNLSLEVLDDNGQVVAEHSRDQIADHLLTGGLAIACSATPPLEVKNERPYIAYPDWGTEANTQRSGNFKFWFRDWLITGSKVKNYPERSFGPILFTQFTVSENKLNLTSQMPPLGEHDAKEVSLELKDDIGKWKTVSTSLIDPLSRTAKFSHGLTKDYPDIHYRVSYKLAVTSDKIKDYHFAGVIPHEPKNKEKVVVAAFTGNNDLGFPNNDLVQSVTLQQPDFLFFSGDQIYEGVGGYGVQRNPLQKAAIDYLRKWYMFGWTYRDLLRVLPSVAIPDDHDVYHGNIWGESGKAANTDLESAYDQQDTGGYKMHPDWVNMVQKTQTSHLPDPFDPAPVKQGIEVYYSNIEYAGLSFAIIEDRKFKSAPKALLPEAEINNGWYQNPDFDPVIQADHPEAVLLGQRQHEFLDWWTKNWEQETWMKVILSQTIFANVATLPREDAMHDRIVPHLRILKEGEYAADDIPVADMDSNGWPQKGRDEALEIIRKAFAFHIAGDQHLGSTIQYGVDHYGDAGYALCVPSVSNVFPRRWFPPVNQETQSYTGNFQDGFGNLMTVMAVSNPVFTGQEPAKLYDRATGYGIVRFNRKTREITLENWPRDADPEKDRPYKGWPITISQKDNYSPPEGAYLPLLKFEGAEEPLVQAFTVSGELVWSIRLSESSTALKVPQPGKYVIRATLNDITQEYPVSATGSIDDRGEVTLEL